MGINTNFVRPSIINIGNSIHDSKFTNYLVDEIIASGFYDFHLVNKNEEEQKDFKNKLKDIWFKTLKHENYLLDAKLTSIISKLSEKRQWSKEQIGQFCQVLNYNVTQETENNLSTWKVTYIFKY